VAAERISRHVVSTAARQVAASSQGLPQVADRGTVMDMIVDLIKAVFALFGLFLVLILIPLFFMSIFVLATSIDRRMNQ
jgi:hypothetical protein